MNNTSNQPINQKMGIVMAGISKIFVGEIVETGSIKQLNFSQIYIARTAMDEWGEIGPLRPQHLREAYRRLKNQ